MIYWSTGLYLLRHRVQGQIIILVFLILEGINPVPAPSPLLLLCICSCGTGYEIGSIPWPMLLKTSTPAPSPLKKWCSPSWLLRMSRDPAAEGGPQLTNLPFPRFQGIHTVKSKPCCFLGLEFALKHWSSPLTLFGWSLSCRVSVGISIYSVIFSMYRMYK